MGVHSGKETIQAHGSRRSARARLWLLVGFLSILGHILLKSSEVKRRTPSSRFMEERDLDMPSQQPKVVVRLAIWEVSL
jgi:hypothetical protein